MSYKLSTKNLTINENDNDNDDDDNNDTDNDDDNDKDNDDDNETENGNKQKRFFLIMYKNAIINLTSKIFYKKQKKDTLKKKLLSIMYKIKKL